MSHALLGLHNIRSVVMSSYRQELSGCQVLQVKITDSTGQEFDLNLFNHLRDDITITLNLPPSETPLPQIEIP